MDGKMFRIRLVGGREGSFRPLTIGCGSLTLVMGMHKYSERSHEIFAITCNVFSWGGEEEDVVHAGEGMHIKSLRNSEILIRLLSVVYCF